MKKTILLISMAICISPVFAKNLSAFFSYSTFDIPGQSPYIETYLKVVGNTVNFIPATDNKLTGQLEVQWIIKSGENIVQYDKYVLHSPAIGANDSIIPNFLDQQRINLHAGTYNLELLIKDKNSSVQPVSLKEKITIGFPTDTISISDIELIESYAKTDQVNKFTKSGYDIMPLINAFYPKEISSLKFYSEIYRSDLSPGDDYLVRYYVTNKESNKIVENYMNSIKQNPKTINVVMGEFDISNLTSGNYFLNIEVRNRKNEIIALNQAFFQRSNERSKPLVTADISAIDISNTFVTDYMNADTLADFIACIYAISSNLENDIAERQIQLRDVRSMQQFMYYFWSKRNPDDPEKAWLDYKLEVMKVNASFTSRIMKGYDTDRGRVYLQYGPPNQMAIDRDSPTSTPYEIWHYYKLNNQTNRRFVFLAVDRSANNYRLIYSDAIGENKDPYWEKILNAKTLGVYGNEVPENFANPR